jgi:cellulose synthase/poly-beta-1,6-N-acetylglucosamine synthase-like glycosyltransferase
MSLTWALGSLGVALLLLGLHPYVGYPLSLAVLRARRQPRPISAAVPAGSTPSFSVCVCAYNEAARIGEQIDRLLALRGTTPGLQLLVYADAPTDGTTELLLAYGERIELVVGLQRRGKTHGMNALVQRARGDILVFTDASVLVEPDSLDRLSPWFADPTVGCVAGSVHVRNAADSAVARVGSLYWRLDDAIRRLESGCGSVMGAHGPLFAIRRELHRAPPDDIIDDMYVSLSVLCQGRRVVLAPDVRVWRRSASCADDEFRRKVRIACQAWNVHRLLWPSLRRTGAFTRYQYVSHKPLRWLSGATLGAGALCVGAAAASAGHPWLPAAAAVGGVAVWFLGHRRGLRPFAGLAALLGALIANLVGVAQSMRGERYQTWEPARSARISPGPTPRSPL